MSGCGIQWGICTNHRWNNVQDVLIVKNRQYAKSAFILHMHAQKKITNIKSAHCRQNISFLLHINDNV